MDSPFIFSREVVNDAFVGRREELSWLSSNLSNKENTVLIAPAGYGKKSLVRNAFIQAKKQTEFKLCTCHLFNVRDEYTFYTTLTHALFSAACATADEWIAVADQLLPLSQPQIIVNERKQNSIQILFDKQRLLENANETLQLAERLAGQQNVPFIIWINDFQEIADFENTDKFQRRLISQWKNHHQVGYILCGSKINAMNLLFAEKQPFHNFAEQIM
ncbi:MAG: ATP-binding protein, partial [Prevotellaceae bacterium]|nr:ATP-binding protein [Prevotellaceae bacterium]